MREEETKEGDSCHQKDLKQKPCISNNSSDREGMLNLSDYLDDIGCDQFNELSDQGQLKEETSPIFKLKGKNDIIAKISHFRKRGEVAEQKLRREKIRAASLQGQLEYTEKDLSVAKKTNLQLEVLVARLTQQLREQELNLSGSCDTLSSRELKLTVVKSENLEREKQIEQLREDYAEAIQRHDAMGKRLNEKKANVHELIARNEDMVVLVKAAAVLQGKAEKRSEVAMQRSHAAEHRAAVAEKKHHESSLMVSQQQQELKEATIKIRAAKAQRDAAAQRANANEKELKRMQSEMDSIVASLLN